MQLKTWVSGAVLLAAAGIGGYFWQQQAEDPVASGQGAAAAAGPKAGGPQAGGPQAGQRPAGGGEGRGPRRAGGPGGAGGNPWNAAVPVRVIEAQTTDLKVQFKTIGTATALNTVLVQPRVGGPLLQLHFTEGQKVEAGQLLAEIDPAPYQVKLAQAEGQLQQNVAQLKNAELDLALYETLKSQNSISRQQYNTQQALVNQLKAR